MRTRTSTLLVAGLLAVGLAVLAIVVPVPLVALGPGPTFNTLGKVEPAWERWAPDVGPRDERLRGGYRWKLALQAGAKKLVKASYEIKIAGKHELVGGNRREP